MYLLSSAELGRLTSKKALPIVAWLARVKPGRNLFASVVSFGVIADSIEGMEPAARASWRRLYDQAKRQFDGLILDVDLSVIDVWATLRSMGLVDDEGEEVGSDELMVIATAIARGYTLVTRREAYLDTLADRTTLTIIDPNAPSP